jgi:hypothetical protein
MKIAALSLLIGSAAAFAPVQTGRVSTANAAAMDDLKAIAEKSNPVLKVRHCPLPVSMDHCVMDDHRLTL